MEAGEINRILSKLALSKSKKLVEMVVIYYNEEEKYNC
jgi:hypothetical protein